jgi:hypothetical protein
VDVIPAQIVRADTIQPRPNVSMKGLEDLEIALAGGRGVMAAHEFVVQTLQQGCHRRYLL